MIVFNRKNVSYSLSDGVFGQVLRHRVKTSDKNVERFRPLPQNVDFVRQKVSKLLVVLQQVDVLVRIRVNEVLERVESHELVEVLVGHFRQNQLPAFPVVGLTHHGGGMARKVFQKTPLKNKLQ
jgi:hypothetical protein